MLHVRPRLVLPKLMKNLKYFPVVAIQGARQTGKSFLAREILSKKLKSSNYLSFDQQAILARAKEQPHSLLAEHLNSKPLIIDEAQKAPHIFDAIKYEVDALRRPGRYVLLGSTEFSRLTRIRESLTGRVGRVRIFPMNLHEALGHHLQRRPTRAQVMHYLKAGGMPAIFPIREDSARDTQFEDWIQLTCTRDILQFRDLKLDPDLTYRLLVKCAQLKEPSRPHLARTLKEDGRRVETHLRALCQLFVLQKIDPYPTSKGKPLYFLLDVGIAKYLGADFERCLQIFLMNERLCKNFYSEEKRKSFYFYRSTGFHFISWIEEKIDGSTVAIQVFESERIKKTDAELMRSFLSKNQKATGFVLAPIPHPMTINGVLFKPWEFL